ncbi:hypothetical protein OC441_002591 [Enterococcus faecalis]|nr:hypothetical protein [Enterococcus faecalis]EJW9248986.1 hypothetical protein [Enterococcus faecalis]
MNKNNKEFIEIYEGEIKRLIKKNEALRAFVEKKENDLYRLQHEKKLMQRELEKLSGIVNSMEQEAKQNVGYKEKVESLTNEKANLICIVNDLRQNTLKDKKFSELASQVENETQKVAYHQEQLKVKERQLKEFMKENEVTNGLMENHVQMLKDKHSWGKLDD